ncbi:MAG: hypothetical protein GX558_05575, partial [Clostridiales bacterium]|nr:hypothetical protein [Clostridiales bacterium]
APTLRAAGETCALLIARCEKLPAKFSDGSPQRTLAIRRLQALQIAKSLIAQELEDFHGKKTP